MSSLNQIPSYCRHRAGNQAYVTLDGRDVYVGKYAAPASRAEYDRRIAEWIAAGRKLPVDPMLITVGEVVLAYKQHADGYYRHADGTPTNEAARVVRELTPLTKLYARTPAVHFGPLRLKAIPDRLIALA